MVGRKGEKESFVARRQIRMRCEAYSLVLTMFLLCVIGLLMRCMYVYQRAYLFEVAFASCKIL
jgi:hypothetical protein